MSGSSNTMYLKRFIVVFMVALILVWRVECTDVSLTDEEYKGLEDAIDRNEVKIITTFFDNHKNSINKPILGVRNHNSYTPLVYACQRRKLGVVHALLQIAGIDVNSQVSDHGMTALMTSTKIVDLEIVRLLLNRGVDSTKKNNEGYSALHIAYFNRHEKIFKALLQKKEAINIQDRIGNTVLNIAVYEHNVPVVKLLLAANADSTIKNNEHKTALHIACESQLNDIVQELLQKKEAIDLQDCNNHTALMLAARIGDPMSVKLLLAAGANCNLKDKDGKTALDHAESKEIKELINDDINRLRKEDNLSWLKSHPFSVGLLLVAAIAVIALILFFTLRSKSKKDVEGDIELDEHDDSDVEEQSPEDNEPSSTE